MGDSTMRLICNSCTCQVLSQFVPAMHKYFGNSNKTTNYGKYGKNHQGYGHGGRTFMHMMSLLFCPAKTSKEGDEQKAEHIKSCKRSRDQSNSPQSFVMRVSTQQDG